MLKKVQLIILPFAGGNSKSFQKIEEFLDEQIEMTTIEYAGRMTRKNQGYITEYDDFLMDVLSQIQNLRKKNLKYALMGYSLGSVILYDLCAGHLLKDGPEHVFICAKESVNVTQKRCNYETISEEDFEKDIVSLGGIDKRIQGNKRFLKIFMEPVRADYIIWQKYKYKPGIIECDGTAIYSSKDCLSENVRAWKDLIAGEFEMCEIGENHFFIYDNWKEVADIINTRLQKFF